MAEGRLRDIDAGPTWAKNRVRISLDDRDDTSGHADRRDRGRGHPAPLDDDVEGHAAEPFSSPTADEAPTSSASGSSPPASSRARWSSASRRPARRPRSRRRVVPAAVPIAVPVSAAPRAARDPGGPSGHGHPGADRGPGVAPVPRAGAAARQPADPGEDLAPTKTSPRLSSSHISESSVTPSETRDIQRHAGQKAACARRSTQTPCPATRRAA